MCVLLDEVESLTRARSAAVSGSEPADAIRAVNALLTQVRHSAVPPESCCAWHFREKFVMVVWRDRSAQCLMHAWLCSWMPSRRTQMCWC